MREIMKKFKKGICFLLMSIFMLGGTCSIAGAEEYSSQDTTTKELMEKFPEFEKSIKENTNEKLAGSSQVYVKYTPKENVDRDSVRSFSKNENTEYETKVYTKEEYLKEIASQSSNRIIGNYECQESSWLKLDLQVYYSRGSGSYMAYSFFEWLTNPIIQIEDAHGISTSANLIIGNNTPKTPIVATYVYDIVEPRTVRLSPIFNDRGIVSKFKFYDRGLNHKGMVMAPVEFINDEIQSGRINNIYLHTQLGCGGIGIDATGMPSLSVGISTDTVQGSVYVSNVI